MVVARHEYRGGPLLYRRIRSRGVCSPGVCTRRYASVLRPLSIHLGPCEVVFRMCLWIRLLLLNCLTWGLVLALLPGI